MTDDVELGLRLVKGIRAACQSRDPDGKPVRGKLVSLALNITSDGWQAITQYWSTNEWNVSVGKDPVVCLVEVLSKEPDLSAPYEPKRRAAAALPVLPLAERIVAGAAPETPAPQQPAPAPQDDLLDLDDAPAATDDDLLV